MKKRVLIIAIIVIVLYILLYPQKISVKDGGSIIYDAVLYSVEYRKAYYNGFVYEDDIPGWNVGTVVTIFGKEVYNDVEFLTIEEFEATYRNN